VLRKYKIPENPPGAISVVHALPAVARELAMIWEAGQRRDVDKRVIAKVVRIKNLTAELLAPCDSLAAAGVSGDMMSAVFGVDRAAVYAERSKPQRGRRENAAALQVAERFKEYYPIITGRKIGSNADHDFVMSLGEIFEILGFKVNPQHYAKRVAAVPAAMS